MKTPPPFSCALKLGSFLSALLFLRLAAAEPINGWYRNANTNGTLTSSPGVMSYVLGPGGNTVLANVGPYQLAVGSSLTFSGVVTNNVSTLLWNDIQFRWGILDNNGNSFQGVAGGDGAYTNYRGYWAGNPNNNSHAVRKLADPSKGWSDLTGVTNLGWQVLSTGSAASSPPLGVYPFAITYRRLNTNQLLVTADLNCAPTGVYSYHVMAVDAAVSTWTFSRVGLFFNPGMSTTGTLNFGELTVTFSNSPLTVLVASDFDSVGIGSDGWSITNTLNGAEPVIYSATNGLYLGGISWAETPDGATSFYVAPAKFLGDKRAAYNGVLSFSLRRTGGGTLSTQRNVILSSTNRELGFRLSAVPMPVPEAGSWFRFEIPLHENSAWENSITQQPATREDILTALAAVNRLWLRAEYTTSTDASDLDMVGLWAQPSGPLQPVLALNQFPSISIIGAVGRSYRLEFKSDLNPTNAWLPLVTNALPTGPYLFTDPTAALAARRFYRAVLIP